MQLILIRHGETSWNKEGRVQGTSDIELSDEGIKQARLLAISLKAQKIDAIHASPLKRAMQTAQIINEYHSLEIQNHQELIEMNQGDFEGLSFKELMNDKKDFLKQWISNPAAVKMPNGESLAELQTRAWQAMEKIIAAGKNSLIVSHNFTIAAILCRLRDISLDEFRRTCVDTASKTVVSMEKDKVIIDPLNDRSHLFLSPRA
ncbi:MAG TPA: histidine phosphatase family protein [Smithellaceae bacterium]|nr:histidine phosphatase family protein [Smithellaceae bacterium]HRS89290.1 histidine phosphatase family protein [Smithellaceae bacterium]HRV25160.1 histidine phosphatase family protein [Smithellaceae bacterium]